MGASRRPSRASRRNDRIHPRVRGLTARRIGELARGKRLATQCRLARVRDEGGLMHTAPTARSWCGKRLATLIESLRAEPGRSPIEQPARLELIVNLKTPGARHLTYPPPARRRV